MRLHEYTAYDAIGLAELVARREVSPAELACAAQRAIEAVDPRIRAVVEHWPAEEADLARRDGPLAGVPFLIKDLGVVMAGKRCELGSRLAAGRISAADSRLMTRMRAAGLVTIGRTATPELGFSTTTEPIARGATANPWAPTRTAGGSSGGAAAAVAAGIVPLAHATDAAGSIRVPAAHTGLFGLKPTRGRMSLGPAFDEVIAGFAVHLGVSRSVRDSAALLDALAGEASGEPYHTAAPAGGFLPEVTRDPGRLTIGVLEHPWSGERSEAPMVRAVQQVARELAALGHEVAAAEVPLGVSWEAFVDAQAKIWTASLARDLDDLAAATGRPIDATAVEAATLNSYDYGKQVRAVEYVQALGTRNRVTRALGAWFERHDVLLTPTMPALPLPLGVYAAGAERMDGLQWTERLLRHSPFTPPFNVAGLPAMSMPLATEGPLPIGLHFGAGFAREAVLFRLAGQLERAMPWRSRRPEVWAGAA